MDHSGLRRQQPQQSGQIISDRNDLTMTNVQRNESSNLLAPPSLHEDDESSDVERLSICEPQQHKLHQKTPEQNLFKFLAQDGFRSGKTILGDSKTTASMTTEGGASYSTLEVSTITTSWAEDSATSLNQLLNSPQHSSRPSPYASNYSSASSQHRLKPRLEIALARGRVPAVESCDASVTSITNHESLSSVTVTTTPGGILYSSSTPSSSISTRSKKSVRFGKVYEKGQVLHDLFAPPLLESHDSSTSLPTLPTEDLEPDHLVHRRSNSDDSIAVGDNSFSKQAQHRRAGRRPRRSSDNPASKSMSNLPDRSSSRWGTGAAESNFAPPRHPFFDDSGTSHDSLPRQQVRRSSREKRHLQNQLPRVPSRSLSDLD